jgi:hypothetical protein
MSGFVLFHAVMLSPLPGFVLVSYAIGVGALRRRLAPNIPFPSSRSGCLALGLLILYVAVASPLEALGERYSFSARMVQHMLMKQDLLGGVRHGHDSGVLESAVHGKSVEAFTNWLDPSDHLDPVLLLNLRFDNGRHDKQAQPFLSKHLEKRAIVELPHHAGAEPL